MDTALGATDMRDEDAQDLEETLFRIDISVISR